MIRLCQNFTLLTLIAEIMRFISAAQAALRQKKAYENELDRIAGTRMTLETQVNAIESANMNLETMTAMRRGADALRNIHGSLCVSGAFVQIRIAALTMVSLLRLFPRNIDRVDTTMDSIREQMDLTNEISDAISNPVGMGHDIDEVRATEEFKEIQMLTL